MRLQVLVCLFAALISLVVASPAPLAKTTTKRATTTTKSTAKTTTVAPAAATTRIHDCSVFIRRWSYNGNLFDIVYHDHYWNSTSTRIQIYEWETADNLQPGFTLDYPLGSHNLRFINVANPINATPWSATDTGKITVTWGNYVGNSWDPATGCRTNVPGHGSGYERATYLCYFQCNVPFSGTPY